MRPEKYPHLAEAYNMAFAISSMNLTGQGLPSYLCDKKRFMNVANFVFENWGFLEGMRREHFNREHDRIHNLMRKKGKVKKERFVYLMRNSKDGLVKIGISKNPVYREKTFQSEQPDVKVLNFWPGTYKDEMSLHAMFKDKRVRGEWFKLSDKDIHTIRRYFV